MRRSRHSILRIAAVIIILLLIFKPEVITKELTSFGKKFGSYLDETISYAPYNDKQVNGAQITIAQGLTKTKDIVLYVKTLKDKDFIKYTKELPKDITSKINCKYNVKLIKDKDNKVTGIKFEEVAGK